MRRLAENLLVLAGDQPHRPNRQPAPLFDILRAAAAEVEDYNRVHIMPTGVDVRVGGTVVGDLIHILAELIENATAFSPVAAEVEVRAGQVGHGWAIEIEDRGVGLDDATLERFNHMFADPPPFQADSGGQIGLVVVARLAARHGVMVRLRRGSYQGVHAVVILPAAILATANGHPASAWTALATARVGRHSQTEARAPMGQLMAPAVAHDAPQRQLSSRAAPGPLPRLPTRQRGAQMADELRTGPPVAAPSNGSPAARPPEHARWLAEGFMNGYARGRQAASPENGRR
jgi:hypothetical protein